MIDVWVTNSRRCRQFDPQCRYDEAHDNRQRHVLINEITSLKMARCKWTFCDRIITLKPTSKCQSSYYCISLLHLNNRIIYRKCHQWDPLQQIKQKKNQLHEPEVYNIKGHSVMITEVTYTGRKGTKWCKTGGFGVILYSTGTGRKESELGP